MTMNEPLVGVLTPVYNGAAFLAEAIESVLAQSYTNWRYVIVDNQSTDDTNAIASAYAARDPRITVVRNATLLPMLANWNATMRQLPADAAYCKVLHADDQLLPDCLAQMVDLAEANPTVVMVGAYRHQGDQIGLKGLAPHETVLPGRTVGRRFLLQGLRIFGSPSSILVRADAVRRRDQFYDEANLHADTQVALDLLSEGDFGFIHEPLTITRVHEGQNTTFAQRMNSYLPWSLWTIRRHGRAFLDVGEYEALTARKMRQYDFFLAQAMINRRERAFWTYHQSVCKALGRPLLTPQLAWATTLLVTRRIRRRLGLSPRAQVPQGDSGAERAVTTAPTRPLPRVSFGIIVLNGEPFTRYCLRALYPFAHEIIVVEGAAPAAVGVATPDGHSTDGTLQVLRRFIAEEDPEGKVRLITRDGFWSEKDEQSRAYAEAATGDYLWQIDIDEFYRPEAMQAVLDMLARRPEVAAVSFRELKFWGWLDYTVDGWYSRRGANLYHRLFRWGPGYRYVTHRPPTVADAEGRNLRDVGYLSGDKLAEEGVFLYHYALLFPKQVLNKSEYYGRAAWARRPESQRWAEECWQRLGRPYRVHNIYTHPSWLERFAGVHPPQIEAMRADLGAGRVQTERRGVEDIEALLHRPWYPLGRAALKLLEVPMRPFDKPLRRWRSRLSKLLHDPSAALAAIQRRLHRATHG